MPGQPKKRETFAKIEELGGWETAVFDRVRAGDSQAAIAGDLGISQPFLSRLIHQDPDRVAAFDRAKQGAARIYAEQATIIADAVPAERDAVAKGRLQVEARLTNAKLWEPKFRDRADVNVNIVDASDLHLAALRFREIPLAQSEALPTSAPEPLQLPKPWPASETDDVTPTPEAA